jgi:hypothetical protein
MIGAWDGDRGAQPFTPQERKQLSETLELRQADGSVIDRGNVPTDPLVLSCSDSHPTFDLSGPSPGRRSHWPRRT